MTASIPSHPRFLQDRQGEETRPYETWGTGDPMQRLPIFPRATKRIREGVERPSVDPLVTLPPRKLRHTVKPVLSGH
jgi:hypothetical protein